MHIGSSWGALWFIQMHCMGHDQGQEHTLFGV